MNMEFPEITDDNNEEKPDENNETLNEQQESREINKANFLMETAQRVLSGESSHGDVVYEDIRDFLENEGKDIDTELKFQLVNIREQVPLAEINNFHQKVRSFIEEGDIVTAKTWLTGAESSLKNNEQKMSPEAVQAYSEEQKKFMSELY